MNTESIRTFLEVASCGNFHRAAETLNVTQSTVSARVKGLEEHFGLPLFRRHRAGVALTAAGQQFRRYALNMQRLWYQAHQAVTLPEGYSNVFSLAAQVSLWDRLILPWIPWMRAAVPGVALRVEADYSTSQMRQLADGLIDIGVMYQPRRRAGLRVEMLFEETLVLVATGQRKVIHGWREDYVFVDWGDAFREVHAQAYPDMETPAVSVGLGALGLQYILQNGGSGYFPIRVVGPLIEAGRLFRVDDAVEAQRPAYVVYHEDPADPALLAQALEGLRSVAREEGG